MNTEEREVELTSEAEEVEASEEQPVDEKKEEKKSDEVDYKEKYYYLAAEMQNLRKRMERESSQLVKFANENLLKDVVDVIDSFELTVKALKVDEDEKIKNIVVGIEMVRKQFLDTLGKHGLQKVETEGEKFDPNFHEALAQIKDESKEDMDIVSEEQSGYVLNGRLLRASKVIVVNNSKD
ncbi:MAG: nucleotide exchange factor GrpE [Halobacteriovoraceae bacterium]|nr:nucleotide exchange factor GrpE [Halobacteriovoraceae bacterium]